MGIEDDFDEINFDVCGQCDECTKELKMRLVSVMRKNIIKAEIKVLQEALMGFDINEMIKSLKALLKGN